MPRVAKARIPGEIIDQQDDAQEADEAQQPETVAVEKSQLEAMFAQMQALTAKVQSLEAAGRSVSRQPDAVAELPNADGIDVAKLKTPILTRQGWLVPENYGANPNAPKAF